MSKIPAPLHQPFSAAEFDARLKLERNIGSRLQRLKAKLHWHRESDTYSVLYEPHLNTPAVPYRGAPKKGTLDDIARWLQSKVHTRRRR